MPQPYTRYVGYSEETIALLNHAEAVLAGARAAVAMLHEALSHVAECRARSDEGAWLAVRRPKGAPRLP
jgi:hypothetical protein